jgi:hypothetical protein
LRISTPFQSLDELFPFDDALGALNGCQVSAMEILCERPQTALSFVATRDNTTDTSPAKHLRSLKAMVPGD